MVNIEQLKKLRESTGISLAECKKALEESNGDIEKSHFRQSLSSCVLP